MADAPRSAAGLPSPTRQTEGPATPQVLELPVIPERYALREKDGVRFLECDEAPRLRAVIDPEMAVSRSEATSLGERVILLDGAGTFGPLIDDERKLYNLDHHAGCERLFTLSTCEQALLLVCSGVELTEGDWTVYANDPDLDTVLALWCLLNNRRLRELRTEARDVLLPLLRLEGAIDANGPDRAALCGLPSELLAQTQRHIDDLMARERGLKQDGAWANKEVQAYTLEMLRAVDALVYSPDDFGDHTRLDEVYGHVEVAPRRVAVACRDTSGIYTAEQSLKSRWGDDLALIALENQPGVWTLRRVSSVSGPKLDPAYERLNRIDPAVDGRPPGKCWGGSNDIGGSPRPHGSRLSPGEILEVLADAYQTPSWWRRTRRSLAAFATGLSLAILGTIAAGAALWLLPLSGGARSTYPVAIASLAALAVGVLATRRASGRRPWTFGWRRPAMGGGLWLSPVALAAALPVAAWALEWLAAHSAGDPADLDAVATLAAGALALGAVEVWFRGLVHGMLALDFRVQRPGGAWLLSRAALVSSLAYAPIVSATIGLGALFGWPGVSAFDPSDVALVALPVAFVAGLALAVIRERSLSLLPGLALQVGALLIAFVLAPKLT